MSLPDDFMQRFDREGRPLTLVEHARKWEDHNYRFVLTTRIGDIACVITIWDGFDPHRFDPNAPHLIFETTVFRPTTDTRRGIQFERSEDLHWLVDDKLDAPRHATEAEALAWHHAIVDMIQRTER